MTPRSSFPFHPVDPGMLAFTIFGPEADFGYALRVLRATQLDKCQRPYDNGDAEKHDKGIIVQRTEVKHVCQCGQNEERHGDKSDRYLEPLEEQRRKSPTLSKRFPHPGIDAPGFPSFDGSHLSKAKGYQKIVPPPVCSKKGSFPLHRTHKGRAELQNHAL